MLSASLLDEGGAVVELEQVPEDLGGAAVPVLHLPQVTGLLVDDGLHAPGDVDEGPLRGLADVLLRGDGLQHRVQHPLVCALESGCEALGVLVDVLEHIGDELALLQPRHRVRQLLPGEPFGLRLLAGQPELQLFLTPYELLTQRPYGSAPSGGFGTEDGHGHRGGQTAPQHRLPGARRDGPYGHGGDRRDYADRQ